MSGLILATGDTAKASDDIHVEPGQPVTVCLKESVAGAIVQIELKDDAGAYVAVGVLKHLDDPAKTIVAPGVYRCSRKAGAVCGVFCA